MRFRFHKGELHVHRCPEHPGGCDYFADHALSWMLGNRAQARAALVIYKDSLVTRVGVLNRLIAAVDALLKRLDMLRAEAG